MLLTAAIVKKIIQQNKKAALQEFLFRSQGSTDQIEEKIQNLQDQVNSLAEQVERLQERVIHLDQEGNLNMLSAAEKMPVKPPLNPQLGNTSLNQINGLNFTNYDYFHNGPNFIPLGKISQQEKIEIIQTGLKVYF